MKTKTLVYRLLLAIAAITAVSGLVQMLGARFMLGMLNADTAPAAAHFFAIVGMFMLLFGGLLLHAGLGQPGLDERRVGGQGQAQVQMTAQCADFFSHDQDPDL